MHVFSGMLNNGPILERFSRIGFWVFVWPINKELHFEYRNLNSLSCFLNLLIFKSAF